MQIKTTVGCHFTPTMATMSKTGSLKASEEVPLLVGIQDAVATLGTVWWFLKTFSM